jgi:CrcB protein
MFHKVLLLAIAGGAGTLARYFLSGFAQRIGNGSLPFGTFTVNMLGCFLFGLVWSLSEDRLLLSTQSRFIILTGFMGAFTTFSTFTFESVQMLREAEWSLAIINLLAQNILGIALLVVGLKVGRLF